MKIFVQGRKRGYNVLFPCPTPQEFYNFATDIQSINAQNQSYFYGQFLYSIAFSSGGRIFTKYVLGYDVQRANLGNISFSIFIPNNKELSGKNIVELLNTLSDKYFNTYAPDFHIKDIQENWSELSSIANQYDSMLKHIDELDEEHFEKGTKEPAYLYYSSFEQLAEYFNEPYQKSYSPYSQVFLIDAMLKGKPENPLNAIKYNSDADLSGLIDIQNIKFRLQITSTSYANVEVITTAGQSHPLNQNEKFYKNEKLCITWAKPYHQQITKEGTIQELKDYLNINDSNRLVTVNPIEQKIKTKDIQPKFSHKYQPIEVENFKCSNYYVNIELKEGKLHFEGEQIEQKWTIMASKGPNLSFKETFIPQKCSNIIHLKATEKKQISFNIVDEKQTRISNVKISLIDKKGEKRKIDNTSIEFTDEELDKTYEILFKAKDYTETTYRLEPRKSENKITIELKHKNNNLRRNLLIIFLALSITLNIIQFIHIIQFIQNKETTDKTESATKAYVNGSDRPGVKADSALVQGTNQAQSSVTDQDAPASSNAAQKQATEEPGAFRKLVHKIFGERTK